MDLNTINHLDDFLSNVPFPIDKEGLVQEALDYPLSDNIRDAIALLPDREFNGREEVKSDLLGVPFDDGTPKKDFDTVEMEEEDDTQTMDNLVNLDEFTQLGDEEDHESV